MSIRLAISIVLYQSDWERLAQALTSLNHAIEQAKTDHLLSRAFITIVDNGSAMAARTPLLNWANDPTYSTALDQFLLIAGHGNVGYGQAHNLALAHSCQADYHLILNPDVIVAKDALAQALRFMADHPAAGLLAPAVVDGQARRQFLCKRYPSVLDLLLRGFAPADLRQRCRQRLWHYEMRDQINADVVWDVPILSGCFMFCRRSVLLSVGGFSPAYFLYFEDFDLSLRAATLARTVYVPEVKIIHFGGEAARKGWRHILLFGRSALTFFNRHGWSFF